jgi:hypothetical protein
MLLVLFEFAGQIMYCRYRKIVVKKPMSTQVELDVFLVSALTVPPESAPSFLRWPHAAVATPKMAFSPEAIPPHSAVPLILSASMLAVRWSDPAMVASNTAFFWPGPARAPYLLTPSSTA